MRNLWPLSRFTNSMPDSYHGRLQSILDLASLSGHAIPIEFLIAKLNEEYDCCGIHKANDNALAAAAAAHGSMHTGGRLQIECYNCHG